MYSRLQKRVEAAIAAYGGTEILAFLRATLTTILIFEYKSSELIVVGINNCRRDQMSGIKCRDIENHGIKCHQFL